MVQPRTRNNEWFGPGLEYTQATVVEKAAIEAVKKIVVKMRRLECWYHRDQQRRKS